MFQAAVNQVALLVAAGSCSSAAYAALQRQAAAALGYC
jgi:hypothetical protein